MEKVQKDLCPQFHRGELWTLHRYCARVELWPFQRNNKLVWDETLRVVAELFEEVWGAEDKVQVEDATDITRSVSNCDHLPALFAYRWPLRSPCSLSASRVSDKGYHGKMGGLSCPDLK